MKKLTKKQHRGIIRDLINETESEIYSTSS